MTTTYAKFAILYPVTLSSLVFGLVFVIAWTLFVQFIPIILIRVLFSLGGVFGILSFVRILRATRIVLDKPSQTVIVRKPSLFLVRRQRVIPFSYVGSIGIDYAPEVSGGGGPYGGGTTSEDVWKVSLDIGGSKTEVAHTTNKGDMLHLASEISKFIGRELVDNSAKPEISLTGFFRKVKGFFRKGSTEG